MLGVPHEEKTVAAQLAAIIGKKYDMFYNTFNMRYFLVFGENGKEIRVSYSINFLSEVEVSKNYKIIDDDIEDAKRILERMK
jgi:glutamine phosphoribosylpyrophosphate amidotransferase